MLGSQPKQKPEEEIQQYWDRTVSWLELRAIVENNGANLNTKYELDSFINGLYYSDAYFACTHTERQSPIDSVKCRYQHGSIVDTLEFKAVLLKIPPSPARKGSSSNLSSPVSKLKFPKAGAFHKNSTALDKKNKHKKRRSYALNSIGFTPDTPLADLVIPSDCTPETIILVNRVEVYLNSLTDPHNNPAR